MITLTIKKNFEKGKSLRAVSKIWMQFWPRITPDNWQSLCGRFLKKRLGKKPKKQFTCLLC